MKIYSEGSVKNYLINLISYCVTTQVENILYRFTSYDENISKQLSTEQTALDNLIDLQGNNL